jgi:hypothetical protein
MNILELVFFTSRTIRNSDGFTFKRETVTGKMRVLGPRLYAGGLS